MQTRVFWHNLRFDQAAKTPRQYEVWCVCFWLVTGWWEWWLVDFWSVDWLIGWLVDGLILFICSGLTIYHMIIIDHYCYVLIGCTQDILRKHSHVQGCITTPLVTRFGGGTSKCYSTILFCFPPPHFSKILENWGGGGGNWGKKKVTSAVDVFLRFLTPSPLWRTFGPFFKGGGEVFFFWRYSTVYWRV